MSCLACSVEDRGVHLKNQPQWFR